MTLCVKLASKLSELYVYDFSECTVKFNPSRAMILLDNCAFRRTIKARIGYYEKI